MKDKITIPTAEQELHINYCPATMGKECEIYTTIPWAMKYLDRMINKFPEDFKLIKDDQYSVTATAPFKLVKPRTPIHMTEEEKQRRASHLKGYKNESD